MFRGNSIFDPDLTGGSAPPVLGFVEYFALYERVRVLASSIKVEYVRNDADT